MRYTDRALLILNEAEARLRKLVSEAASTPSRAQSRGGTTAKTSKAVEHLSRKPSEPYPRFYKDGDRLVRVAWSKREKAEYEHKAPYRVLSALGAAVVEAGVDGRVFPMEELLPIRTEDGSEVPSYQAYVALALLKQVGLIDQHGRQGYSIPRPKDLLTAVEAVWRNLPAE
jgi:hypothetical protein